MKIKVIIIALMTAIVINSNAQEREKFGNTLNLSLGIGYYGYVGHPAPFGSLNYEFDVVRNFTLAPFVGIYTYTDGYYWGDPAKPINDPTYRDYSYRQIAIPLGVKGCYYFDELLRAGSKWDFYVGTSVGFVIRTEKWEDGYYGNTRVNQSTSPLYLNMHIGSEYHFAKKTGVFLDLSTGVSTVGLAVHF